MPNICTICNKPIILKPSAKERAAKFGGRVKDYERLFTTHSQCLIDQREKATLNLIRRTNQTTK